MIRLFCLGLLQWRRPLAGGRAAGAQVFYYHRTGIDFIMTLVVAASTILEVAVLHIILHKSHPRVAGVLIVLGVFGIICAVGLSKVFIWQPTVLTEDRLVICYGAGRHLTVSRRDIIQALRIDARSRDRAVTRAYFVDEPNISLVTSRGTGASGSGNEQTDVPRRIEFRVDEPGLLLQRLNVPDSARAPA